MALYQEIISEYNKMKASNSSSNSNSRTGSSEGRLHEEEIIFNCERIVRECVEQVEFNLGEKGLRASKEALVELVTNLVLERAKCQTF